MVSTIDNLLYVRNRVGYTNMFYLSEYMIYEIQNGFIAAISMQKKSGCDVLSIKELLLI